MTDATRTMVRGWLTMHKGDTEGLARWMRTLGIGSLRACRELIAEALNA